MKIVLRMDKQFLNILLTRKSCTSLYHYRSQLASMQYRLKVLVSIA
jgi:hypothetical protein